MKTIARLLWLDRPAFLTLVASSHLPSSSLLSVCVSFSPAAYETLSDKSLRSQYDAMIGPQGVDPNYATSRGPPPSGPRPPPAPDFDYEAFFRKFDDVLRKHAETHMAAVKDAGIDTAGVADHLKQHLRDHAKMHEGANRAHAMAMHNAGHPQPHGAHKYARPREDLLLEGLFDDVGEDEEATFQQHLETTAHSKGELPYGR